MTSFRSWFPVSRMTAPSVISALRSRSDNAHSLSATSTAAGTVTSTSVHPADGGHGEGIEEGLDVPAREASGRRLRDEVACRVLG